MLRVTPSRDQNTVGGGAPVVEQVNCRVSPSASTCGCVSMMDAVGRTAAETHVCVMLFIHYPYLENMRLREI